MTIPINILERLNVTREPAKYGKGYIYHIPCCKCGGDITSRHFSLDKEYTCMLCKAYDKKKVKAKEKALTEQLDIRTKHEKRFDEAVEIISSQADIKLYDKAIQSAESKCEEYGSIPEAIMSILLIYNGLSIIPQQKIGRYRVDFAIPQLKIIIEVDGAPYHSNKNKELEREASINYSIGLDWKIIHVSSDKIKDINRMNKFIGEVIRGQYTIV